MAAAAGNLQSVFRLRPEPFRMNPAGQGLFSPIVEKLIRIRKNCTARNIDNGFDGKGYKNYTNTYDQYCKTFRIDLKAEIKEAISRDKEKGPKFILEIGPAFAVAARELQKKLGDRATVVGVDILEMDQRKFRPDLPPIPVFPGMAECLPFLENELFNAVIAHRSLYNSLIPNKIFSEVFRVLKPGGVAFMMFGWMTGNGKRKDHPIVAEFKKVLSSIKEKQLFPLEYFDDHDAIKVLFTKTDGCYPEKLFALDWHDFYLATLLSRYKNLPLHRLFICSRGKP